jgi:tetratricopeptide (TPR) repeat protein
MIYETIPTFNAVFTERLHTLNKLGLCLLVSGEADKALLYLTKSLENANRLRTLNLNGGDQPFLADCYMTLGVALEQLGRFHECLYCYREDLIIREEIALAAPEDSFSANCLSTSFSNLARTLQVLEQSEEALECQKKSLRIAQQLSILHPEVTHMSGQLAIQLAQTGEILACQNRYAEGAEYYNQSLALFETLHCEAPANATIAYQLINCLLGLSQSLVLLEQHDEALSHCIRSFGVTRLMRSYSSNNTLGANSSCAIFECLSRIDPQKLNPLWIKQPHPELEQLAVEETGFGYEKTLATDESKIGYALLIELSKRSF